MRTRFSNLRDRGEEAVGEGADRDTRGRVCSPDHEFGFTLMEIIIAITVFSFIMVSILGCWKCIVKGKMVAEDAAVAALRSRVGMKTVAEALTCAEISSANIEYYGFLADTSGKFAYVTLAARLPEDFPGSGLFGDNVMRRITFDVQPDAEGKANLMMYQSPLLGVVDDENPPYTNVLTRDVNVFMLEFWSVEQGEWEVSWEVTNKLPPLVRVTLGSGHSANNPDVPYSLICRTVAIPSEAH